LACCAVAQHSNLIWGPDSHALLPQRTDTLGSWYSAHCLMHPGLFPLCAVLSFPPYQLFFFLIFIPYQLSRVNCKVTYSTKFFLCVNIFWYSTNTWLKVLTQHLSINVYRTLSSTNLTVFNNAFPFQNWFLELSGSHTFFISGPF
jgi:hypothetical protein